MSCEEFLVRISNSFSEDEAAVLAKLCRDESMRRGSALARSKAFASLWKKALQMGERVRAQSEADRFDAARRRS